MDRMHHELAVRRTFSLALAFAALSGARLPHAQQALVHVDGTSSDERLGASVAGLGDVDGDGIPDFAVGSTGATPMHGRAAAISGASGATLFAITGTSPNLAWNTLVAGPGDLNGDGVPDLLHSTMVGAQPDAVQAVSGATGVPLYLLSEGTPQAHFGSALATVGDVDGDGISDTLVGAPNFQTVSGGTTGAMYVFSGANGQLLHAFVGPDPLKALGETVAAAGDVDLDGVPDFIASSHGGGSPEYAVRVFSGATNAPLQTISSNTFQFGYALCGPGDLTGDGVPDVVISAPSESAYGHVHVHSGASGAQVADLLGLEPFARLGDSLAALGDVDGDGLADFAAGASGAFAADGQTGAVRVYSGLGPQSGIETIQPAGLPKAEFGFALANAGDVDGDGAADLVIGARRFDADHGRASVYSLLPKLPTGLVSYGVGTAGCAGGQLLNGNQVPRIGAAGFKVSTTHAPASSAGVLALSPGADFIGSNSAGLGVVQSIDLAGAWLWLVPVASDALGANAKALPIPNDLGLVGTQLYAQEFWLWSGTACTPSASSLSSSRGLRIQIKG